MLKLDGFSDEANNAILHVYTYFSIKIYDTLGNRDTQLEILAVVSLWFFQYGMLPNHLEWNQDSYEQG